MEMSGGQRKRLMLSRALYHDFDLLILDEPFSEMDEDSETDILIKLQRLAEQGKIIILITHNPNLVVNTDAEQVVVATCGRQANGLPAISYAAGPCVRLFVPHFAVIPNTEPVWKVSPSGRVRYRSGPRSPAAPYCGLLASVPA